MCAGFPRRRVTAWSAYHRFRWYRLGRRRQSAQPGLHRVLSIIGNRLNADDVDGFLPGVRSSRYWPSTIGPPHSRHDRPRAETAGCPSVRSAVIGHSAAGDRGRVGTGLKWTTEEPCHRHHRGMTATSSTYLLLVCRYGFLPARVPMPRQMYRSTVLRRSPRSRRPLRHLPRRDGHCVTAA